MTPAPRSRPHLIAATIALLSGACASLTGRARDDASDGAARDAAATDASPADAPPPARDAARCVGAAPAIEASEARFEGPGDAGTALHGVEPRAVVADASGHLYVAGYCGECAPGRRFRAALWRFDARAGSLDASWATRGLALEGTDADHADAWHDVAFDPQGRLVTAGHRQLEPTRVSVSLARFTADGRLDRTFGDAGRVSLALERLGLPYAFAYAVLADGDGVVALGSNQSTWAGIPDAAWVARFTAGGALDATFGDGGVVIDATLRGCFDVARDGDRYALACVSGEGARPVLLRLDRDGRRSPWPAAPAASEHPSGRPEFNARALLRDSAGRWLVGGVTSIVYGSESDAPQVVRYLPDGAPDLAYGARGAASLPGLTLPVVSTFASAWGVTCDDRLLVGASLGPDPVIAVLDAEGRAVEGGDVWFRRLSARAGGRVAAMAVVPLSSSRAVVVTSYGPPPFRLGFNWITP